MAYSHHETRKTQSCARFRMNLNGHSSLNLALDNTLSALSLIEMHFTREELLVLGLAEVSAEARVHRSVAMFGCERIRLRGRVRVDCFAVLSAGEDGIDLGDHVHVAAGCYLFGGGGRIVMEDFAGLSSRVSVYTASDDYVDGHLTNPTVPDEFRQVATGDVILRKHAIVGASSVILPGVELGIGSAVGALTCVRKSVSPFEICANTGGRARTLGKRSRRLLELEAEFRKASQSSSPRVH